MVDWHDWHDWQPRGASAKKGSRAASAAGRWTGVTGDGLAAEAEEPTAFSEPPPLVVTVRRPPYASASGCPLPLRSPVFPASSPSSSQHQSRRQSHRQSHISQLQAALPAQAMSHPPPTPPLKQHSESEPDLPLYTSTPTLDVPAVGEDGRPPPVKFMCAALRRCQRPSPWLPRPAADGPPGQHPPTRALCDTTSARPRPPDASRCAPALTCVCPPPCAD